MLRRFAALPMLAAMLLVPGAASATCVSETIVQLPVTMSGRSPIVTVKINNFNTRLILSSGTFFSMLSHATVQEYGLSTIDLGGARVKGIGGSSSLSATAVRELDLGGHSVRDVEFAVGGSDMGFAGILGQNILGLADVEYDLPHGMMRIRQSKDCHHNDNMAYWSPDRHASVLEINALDGLNKSTIGTVTLNGVRLRAKFDSGAGGGAMLSLAAAKRLGITPDSPGVTQAGFATGVGQSRTRLWLASFDKIDIGGELINKPAIRIIDQSLGDVDMAIGVDFFLTHRIYVDNRTHKMFFTYEGGPVFGLDPKGAYDDKGAALDLTDKSGEPTDAAGFSRRGAVLAADRKFDVAIADFDKAVALAPDNVRYLVQRAQAHLANRQPLLGTADLDKAIGLAPADSEALIARAQVRSANRDAAGALADLRVADVALAPESEARLQLAAGYVAMGAYDFALASYDLWLKAHPEDSGRAVAFNGRCRARALANRELDKAMADCDAALRMRRDDPAFLDSNGLVHFRRGEWDKAIADYSAVVAAQPRNGLAFYTRSLVERRAGKAADADRDLAAALAINPQVAARAKAMKIEE